MTVANQEEKPVSENIIETTMHLNNLLPDLEGPFKQVITDSINEILCKRPMQPIRVLAEHLLEKSDSHEIEKHECVIGINKNINISCTLTKACTRKNGAEALNVPGLPLLLLVSPTSFELDAGLRHLDSITSHNSKIIVFIESPNPPTDLFFLKGVPYFADITEQILQKRRNNNNNTDSINYLFNEKLSECVGSSNKITELLQETLQMGIKTLREEINAIVKPTSKYSIIELPEVQSNFLEIFDVMDKALGLKKHHWEEYPNTQDEIPSVLLISFNSQSSHMTFSRIIAAMLPLYEAQQRRRIALTLEKNKSRIRQFNYKYITEYWTSVLQRRDERDKLRGISKGITPSPSPKRRQKQGEKNNKNKKKNRSTSLIARSLRRENEDTTFLRVSQYLQSQAATRIQALYRGYKLRKRIEIPHHHHHNFNTNKKKFDINYLIEELPSSLPTLLRRCVERLNLIHGELFGNYITSCPPVPRCVSILKPKREIIKIKKDDNNNDDDENNEIESEAETWEEEQVILPLQRQTKVLPHFNVLRRLMECEYLSKSNTIEYATSIQNDCSGLSILQRRAYDCYKSLVLNILHIAFLELYHRQKLPIGILNFHDYMYLFHADIFGWFSAPHLFTRISSRFNENLIPQSIPILCDKETVETERVLLVNAYRNGQIYLNSYRQEKKEKEEVNNNKDEKEKEDTQLLNTKSLTSINSTTINNNNNNNSLNEESKDLWDCVDVYAAPGFLSEISWENALSEVSHGNRNSKIAWWSLNPNPAVYINGEPVVLFPRHELQEVEGRPKFDEHILRIDPAKKKTSSDSRRSSRTKERKSLQSDNINSNSRRNSCSGVSDGLSSIVVDHDTQEAPAKLNNNNNINININPSINSPAIFGASLLQEDAHLAHFLLTHEAGAVRHAAVGPIAPPAAIITSSSSSFIISTVIPPPPLMIAPAPVVNPPPSRVTEEISSSFSAGHVGGGRSSRRRSELRASWSKTIEAARGPLLSLENSRISLSAPKQLPSPRVSEVSTPGRGQQMHNLSLLLIPEIETVDSVAHKVAHRVLEEGNFIHERPWMIPVCGRSWVLVFEQFISKCLLQMREGYIIILSVDNPCQLLLFNAVCLLKHAMLHYAKSSRSKSITSEIEMNPLKKKIPPPILLSNETSSCISFLNSFYQCVADLVKQSDISVLDCVFTVQKIMKENSPNGLMFLEELPLLIKNAERETNRRILEESIINIVQRIELYCWLVLFQAYLESLVISGVFEKSSDVKLSPFSAFVNDNTVMNWIECIDPWQNEPNKSPDPFHLRYSNGLRRWDDRSYIFHGAI